MEKIIQLTHTDIHADARILKQVEILREKFNVIGYGFSKTPKSDNGLITFENKGMKIFLYFSLFFEVMQKDSDYIQSNDWYVLFIAIFHKFKYGSKVIYDAHELESNVNTTNKFRNYFAYIFEFLFIRYVDVFITVSDSILDWYKNEFPCIQNKKMSVINNVPLKVNDNTSKNKNDDNNKVKVVYVGGIEDGRGIVEFIKYVNKIDFLEFHIFGYGSKEEEYINKYSNNDIYFHGKVHHSDVVNVISDMDFGLCLIEPVSLSDKLCLPNKLFEYYNSNLNIIGSNLPEISRFINNKSCGFLLDKRDTVDILSENLLKFKGNLFKIDDSYTWNVQKYNYIGLFNE